MPTWSITIKCTLGIACYLFSLFWKVKGQRMLPWKTNHLRHWRQAGPRKNLAVSGFIVSGSWLKSCGCEERTWSMSVLQVALVRRTGGGPLSWSPTTGRGRRWVLAVFQQLGEEWVVQCGNTKPFLESSAFQHLYILNLTLQPCP